MIEKKFANLANCNIESKRLEKRKKLSSTLDSLSELLGIEYGSVTVNFHQGQWSPKIQIQKTVLKKVD
jgi:hypothetical protein